MTWKGKTEEISGGEQDTTNLRMELTAACVALEAIDEGHIVTVYSDASYLVNCMRRGWYKKWRENGWLNHRKEPVANRDLWERLLQATHRHQEVRWRKVKGRKRHILVDTEGFVLKAKVHSAKVMDYEGIKTLLHQADRHFPRLSHLWLDAGYRGEDKGKDWVQKTLGWSVDLVERPRQPAPKEVLKTWAREWAKEGVKVDWQHLLPPKGFQVLPRRWIVERTFSWIDQNRRMSKDYERLCASGEALVYAAMILLMVRRLSRA